jgi:hypothetical protein
MLLQERYALRPQVEAVVDPETIHLGGGRRAYTVELANRKSLDKSWSHPRGDDEQPVRLVVVGGQLGQELVVGDPGRGGQRRLGLDAGPDALRDFGRGGDSLQVLGDVEIGLVEREGFDY